MVLKAAFIFIAPLADPEIHRCWVKTPQVELLSVAVADYKSAADLVEKLISEEGIKAVELCGGFGHQGVALVKNAAAGRAAVGVVRFDLHPGLENKSGDEFF